MNGVMTNEARLALFNQTFHEVLVQNAQNVNCPIIDEDGVIHIENLKRITDKLGMGSLDFYRKEKDEATQKIVGKCIKIPSKDMLLLMAVCLELDTETAHTLLRAAGYGNYLKNLKEFIIFCGLNNIKSIDDVSKKLFQYGFREQAALMTVSYRSEKDIAKRFSDYFIKLCAAKDYDKKKILERAGLVSAQLDSENNKYYYNAFNGQKSVKIVLNHTQVMRLFTALDLDVSEKMEYLRFLLELDVIHEDSIRILLDSVNVDTYTDEGDYPAAKALRVDHNSVFTQYMTNKLDHLHWHQLDGFISQTFSSIRSFAVFYNQLVAYEGFRNIAELCNEYGLSTKSHYNYVLGITLPELTTLTAFSFLFRKMTIQIYNTLLKKAGKCIFDNNEDSIVYIIAKELLINKKSGVSVFGDLYDFVESFVIPSEDNQEYLYEDLGELYLELVKIISRNLLSYAKNTGLDIKTEDQAILKALAENLVKSHILNYSEYFGGVLRAGGDAQASGFAQILKDKFGFSEDSALIGYLHNDRKRNAEGSCHG
jgi:hypothetical protein